MEITQEQIMHIKNNAHDGRVYTCCHYLDEKDNRDLVITGSYDKTIKIWELNNGFQLLYMKKPDYNFQENTYLLSEALLYFSDSLYLIASAYELKSSGYYLLYYNLKHLNQKNKLSNSKDNCNYLETFNTSDVPFIISANLGNIKIFDFEQKKLIKKFSDNNNSINYLSVVIQTYADKASLIATSSDGFLRIWDYNNPSIIIYKIQSYLNNWLIGLELIDNRFLLAGCADGSIKEFDLLKNYVAYTFPREDKEDPLFTLKYTQINGKNYLFSHSHKGLIELWQ
jgi:WD40 repeat protein